MLSAQFFVSGLVIVVLLHAMLLSTAYLILLERKTASWVQDRTGPNRTNFSFGLDDLWKKLGINGLFEGKKHLGLGQALADGLKLFVKEDYTPPGVDKALFIAAPALAVIPALIGWAVIPWGGLWDFPGITMFGTELVKAGTVSVAVAPVQIGVIYILAVSSLAVYGVVVGAYASNNKYSFLGGLRATAQMVSYEIPMGLCVLIMILTYATPDTQLLTNLQTAGAGGVWGIVTHPLLAIIFFICILAECNRAPFDLAETEQELVGGFHTEFSSMKWALFFLGEYMHMIAGSAFFCVLFLGGWSLNPVGGWIPLELPVSAEGWLAGILIVSLKIGVFAGKVFLLLFLMMWVRWTLPRLRFDQLMKLAWRGLIPLMLLMLLLSGFIIFLDLPAEKFWLFVANIVLLLVGMFVGPRLPQGPPVNRRIPLAGSRYSPLESEATPDPA
ncbi:complex I subunit 1/NuoH family protein [Algisphaera agarilytica]|uniref:NADH-quinone oxidoreductase subunit H n=1 Tax=Algisphaera agarilytica TaxID=1385975 RepID=A0A7X0H8H1_9BACT|nr:complex I subunit 1 family protein [Algisphaera agarilytica]MBB6430987.1 NADH-quinone oxidoreductase subunit H [Algisphaera agarilytica]